MNLLPRGRNPRLVAKQALSFALLAVIVVLAYTSAYLLRFGGSIPVEFQQILFNTWPTLLAVRLAVFAWFRVRLSATKYLSFHELSTLFEATTLGSLLVVLIDAIFWPSFSIARSIVILEWGGTLLVVGAVFAAARWFRERYRPLFIQDRRKAAFIVGANDNGAAVLQAVHRSSSLNYRIVGFIDDNPMRVGARIGGVPVLGTLGQARHLAQLHQVSVVLVTSGDASGRQVQTLIEECAQAKVSVRMLPSFEQLLSGKVAIRARDVSIEDILRRDPVRLETENIRRWLEGRTLLVTGSAGSIGSEVCRQLLQFAPRKLILVDRSENGQFMLERELRELVRGVELEIVVADVTDLPRMRRIFEQSSPEVLFHAAAYKHVPLMEAHPGEAVKNNVLATRLLADLADEQGLEAFVLISTDKAVNPTSVMGACKRVAEMYVQALAESSACRFITVRFGNVLDSAASVVPIFRAQIAQGGPVTVTDPRMRRYFMTIPEAAQLVIQAGVMGRGGEVLVLDMGEPVKIVDLAKEMIRLSGLRYGQDIEIEYVGLRPGEKLYEELHIPGEEHQATRHPKIVVARCQSGLSLSEMQATLELLRTRTEESPAEIVAALRQIVQEYRSSPPPPKSLRLFTPGETAVSEGSASLTASDESLASTNLPPATHSGQHDAA